VGGRRKVWISHAQIDYVISSAAQLHLQFIDHLEDIGGKPFDPSEFFHVHLPPCPRADDAR
jgi:hypothetical protein